MPVMNVHADEFAGTGSRWPVPQLKSIVTDSTNTYVFVGDGDILNVFRRSDTDFKRIAHLRIGNTTEGIRTLAYYETQTAKVIYAACGYSGVQVVNVENPRKPTQQHVSSYTTSAIGTQQGTNYVRAYDIAIHGKYAYIADNTFGIRVLYLNTPLAPQEIGTLNMINNGTEYEYHALGVDIYATGYQSDVTAVALFNTIYGPVIGRILVTNIGSSPIELTRDTATNLPSIMGSMSVHVRDFDNGTTDKYAYCVDSFGNDILIYDVHQIKVSPRPVFSQSRSGYGDNYLALFQPRAIDFRTVTTNDTTHLYAYVTTHYPAKNEETGFVLNPGLSIINMDDVTHPTVSNTGRIIFPGANSVKVAGDDVYVASQVDGIYRIKITADSNGNLIPPADDTSGYNLARTPINAEDIYIVNNEFVFLCDNLDSVDYAEPDEASDIHYGGLTILRVKPMINAAAGTSSDLASPAFPVHETFLQTPGKAKAFCIKDSYENGYIADGSEGIQFIFFDEGNLSSPRIISGSNLPVAQGYEVIDVDTNGDNTLIALSTEPSGEIWGVDVTTSIISKDIPINYTDKLSKADLPGDGTALKIKTYKGQTGLYALVANGINGLAIVKVIPDTENPVITLPPQPSDIVTVNTGETVNVFADPERTGIYAFTVSQTGTDSVTGKKQFGVKIVRLFDENNLSLIDPQIVTTIDTSTYGNAVDVSYFEGHLYVLTDNPDSAMLLYNMDDIQNPVFKGYSNSYGRGRALWTTRITLPCEDCLTGYSYIKGVFIADGPGGLSFRQVTNDSSGISDRVWPGDEVCFISSVAGQNMKTGLFPVFVFLSVCMGFVVICMILIRHHGINRKKHKEC